MKPSVIKFKKRCNRADKGVFYLYIPIAQIMSPFVNIEQLEQTLHQYLPTASSFEAVAYIKPIAALQEEEKEKMLSLVLVLSTNRHDQDKLLTVALGPMAQVIDGHHQLQWMDFLCKPKHYPLLRAALNNGFKTSEIPMGILEHHLSTFFFTEEKMSWDYWERLSEIEKRDLTPFVVEKLGMYPNLILHSSHREQWEQDIRHFSRAERIRAPRDFFFVFWQGVEMQSYKHFSENNNQINDYLTVFEWIFPAGMSPEIRESLMEDEGDNLFLDPSSQFFEIAEPLLEAASSRFDQKELASATPIQSVKDHHRRL